MVFFVSYYFEIISLKLLNTNTHKTYAQHLGYSAFYLVIIFIQSRDDATTVTKFEGVLPRWHYLRNFGNFLRVQKSIINYFVKF